MVRRRRGEQRRDLTHTLVGCAGERADAARGEWAPCRLSGRLRAQPRLHTRDKCWQRKLCWRPTGDARLQAMLPC